MACILASMMLSKAAFARYTLTVIGYVYIDRPITCFNSMHHLHHCPLFEKGSCIQIAETAFPVSLDFQPAQEGQQILDTVEYAHQQVSVISLLF